MHNVVGGLVARTAGDHPYLVRVSPSHSLVRNGMLSYALLSLPLFGVLYYLGASNGSWPIALAAHFISLVLVGAIYLRFRSLFIGVTGTSVHERGLFSRETVVPLSQVRRAILVATYRSSSTETVLQLLLRGTDDRRLLRMRGVFWSEADMRAVAAATGASLTERTDPITAKVLFEEYPGSAYWFENRPTLTILAIIVSLVAVLGLVLALMALMGIPTDNPL